MSVYDLCAFHELMRSVMNPSTMPNISVHLVFTSVDQGELTSLLPDVYIYVAAARHRLCCRHIEGLNMAVRRSFASGRTGVSLSTSLVSLTL